jgi:hypothetical protein
VGDEDGAVTWWDVDDPASLDNLASKRGSRNEGNQAGSGWLDFVVVLLEGLKAAGSIVSGSNGKIPVLWKDDWIVEGLNVSDRAWL